MGAVKWIFRKLGGFGRKLAVRSRWLAKRLWVVMLADVLWTTRRHWVRLEPQERSRLLQLARKSEGRPAKNLTQARAARGKRPARQARAHRVRRQPRRHRAPLQAAEPPRRQVPGGQAEPGKEEARRGRSWRGRGRPRRHPYEAGGGDECRSPARIGVRSRFEGVASGQTQAGSYEHPWAVALGWRGCQSRPRPTARRFSATISTPGTRATPIASPRSSPTAQPTTTAAPARSRAAGPRSAPTRRASTPRSRTCTSS